MRKVTFKLTANSASEFSRFLHQQVIPRLGTQKGFQDKITLVTSQRNEAIAIGFWDHQDNADAYNHVLFLDVLRGPSKVLAGMPVVETFDFVDSTLQEIATGAAKADSFRLSECREGTRQVALRTVTRCS